MFAALPPPKNNDRSNNNTSSPRREIEMWMGRNTRGRHSHTTRCYLHWALKHLFFFFRGSYWSSSLPACLCLSRERRKKRGSRAMSLNVIWIEWHNEQKAKLASISFPKFRFSDGYLSASARALRVRLLMHTRPTSICVCIKLSYTYHREGKKKLATWNV